MSWLKLIRAVATVIAGGASAIIVDPIVGVPLVVAALVDAFRTIRRRP